MRLSNDLSHGHTAPAPEAACAAAHHLQCVSGATTPVGSATDALEAAAVDALRSCSRRKLTTSHGSTDTASEHVGFDERLASASLACLSSWSVAQVSSPVHLLHVHIITRAPLTCVVRSVRQTTKPRPRTTRSSWRRRCIILKLSVLRDVPGVTQRRWKTPRLHMPTSRRGRVCLRSAVRAPPRLLWAGPGCLLRVADAPSTSTEGGDVCSVRVALYRAVS